MKYDYLIVGAGLFGSVFAHEAKKAGYSVIVVDQRDHIGGNAYSEKIEGIDVHRYGAHIFHTDNQAVWDYIRQFADFNDYRHRVIARLLMKQRRSLRNKKWELRSRRILKNSVFSWSEPTSTESW